MFEDARLKIARASALRIELLNALQDHHTRHPPQSSFRPATAENPTPEIRTTIKSPPRMISAIIGDVIHNLRTALDVLAVQLVENAGGNGKNVHFPFCASEDELDATARKRGFDRAGPEAMAVLRSARPYHGGDADLRALHDLDIRDKHKAIIPVSNSVSSAAIQLVGDFPDLSVQLVPGSAPSVSDVFPADVPLAGEEINAALHRLELRVVQLIDDFELSQANTHLDGAPNDPTAPRR